MYLAAHCCKAVLDHSYDVVALFGTDERRNPTNHGGFSERIYRKNLIINTDYNDRGGAHRKYIPSNKA